MSLNWYCWQMPTDVLFSRRQVPRSASFLGRCQRYWPPDVRLRRLAGEGTAGGSQAALSGHVSVEEKVRTEQGEQSPASAQATRFGGHMAAFSSSRVHAFWWVPDAGADPDEAAPYLESWSPGRRRQRQQR